MVSWATIQTITVMAAPILIPRALTFYRNLRRPQPKQLHPVPRSTSITLLILTLSALIALASTLPLFHPENIFRVTSSRLHTSGGVLMTRLASHRAITPFDESLRAAFDAGGLPARLRYVRFGPRVIAEFTLKGAADESKATKGLDVWYLLYALPGFLAPHLLHLGVLAVATSSAVGNLVAKAAGPVVVVGARDGERGTEKKWRTWALVAGVVLAVAEVWWVASYDDEWNERSTRATDIDFVYWKLLLWRGLAIATVDAVLGWAIWAQNTGRYFVVPVSQDERVMAQIIRVDAILAKTRALAILRNSVVRSGMLRAKVDDYWVKDSEVMKEVDEEPEVVQAQRQALGRLNLEQITNSAGNYVDKILGAPMPVAGQPIVSAPTG